VRAQREVLVAKGGRVQGDIHTRDVVVGGEVVGSIFADERIEVQQGAVVQGDIATKKLVIQEGGEVNGQIRMGEAKAAMKPAEPAAT
jgi:cytoskeletal protein CcmA (bactofilin family)